MPAGLARTMVMDGDWLAMAEERLISDFTLTASRNNAAPLELRIDGGAAQLWPAGVSAPLRDIDLARLSARGQAGDRLFVAAGRPGAVAVPRGTAAPTLLSAYFSETNLWLVLNFTEAVEVVRALHVTVYFGGKRYEIDAVHSHPADTFVLVAMFQAGVDPGHPDRVAYEPDDTAYVASALTGRRVAPFESSFSTTGKPQPVAAVYRPGDAEAEVEFDRPIRGVPGEAIPAHEEFQLHTTFGGNTYVVVLQEGAVNGNKAVLANHVSSNPQQSAPDSIDYFNSRPVLFSLTGAPVDAFSGFPLIVEQEESGGR
ncbi:MAG: hypothetical protein DCC67_07550 [Planctomycetota bacterium]|nr:MAG: hypothetical protein DCC67_07550 [Planctomycetota bacterium]